MKINKITPSWFYTEVSIPFRFLQIYVSGDAIILIPFIIFILLTGIFSLKWMLVIFCLYLVFRFLGEMIYWLLQQFGDKKYRPYDFGFKSLDNNGVYILYQLSSLVWLVISCGMLLFLLQY